MAAQLLCGCVGHRTDSVILVPPLLGPGQDAGTSGGFVCEEKAVHSDFWWDLARPCAVCTQRGKLLCARLSAPCWVSNPLWEFLVLLPVLSFRRESNAGGPGVGQHLRCPGPL